MTHSPPIPDANQSPYPLREPSHARTDTAAASERSATDRLRDLPLLAIGATIGLGAALVGGAVYGLMRARPARRGKRGRRKG